MSTNIDLFQIIKLQNQTPSIQRDSLNDLAVNYNVTPLIISIKSERKEKEEENKNKTNKQTKQKNKQKTKTHEKTPKTNKQTRKLCLLTKANTNKQIM